MDILAGLSRAGAVIVGTAFLCLSIAQILHTFLLSIRQTQHRASFFIGYEASLVACLAVFAVIALDVQPLDKSSATLFFNSILWLNAPVIACGVIEISRYRKWIAALDASALFLAIPPIAKLFAGFATSVALIELAYFSGRLLFTLAHDFAYRKSHITRLSIMESMKSLPDGILCSDAYGDILFMNDKMRFYLQQLEMPADLSDANSIRRELMARGTKLNVLKPGLGSVSTSLSLSSTMVCLFVFDKMTIRNREYLRVIAYDITEKAKLAQEIEGTNSRLEETAVEILDSISALRSVAETQAMLQMRSRVHDIIGQRLSIVHRLLESGDYSDESIRRMQPLLKGILNDLLPASTLSPEEDLSLMRSALGMAGVTLSFHGKLPNDESVAKAMVSIVREAATNAICHAQALNIAVSVGIQAVDGGKAGKAIAELVVTNDGLASKAIIREGSGIKGMRHAAERAGGRLRVISHPQFRVDASFPLDAKAFQDGTAKHEEER
ncbi:sensor histidine kinase [Adlercreutzia equolifaciens]|uniref:sensor histidine kinase n=1 Tax=Adlercreutzia equolifaciens TaxID=446660 RepID=UPI003521C842